MSGPDDGPGDQPSDPGAPGGPDDVGSVGDEAAKLFDALSDWASDQGVGTTQGLGALAGAAATAAAGLGEHVSERLATGSAECTYCPICRTMHALRQTSPEVRANLAAAASSLLQAAAGLLTTPPPPGGAAPQRSENLETIDLDDPPHPNGDLP